MSHGRKNITYRGPDDFRLVYWREEEKMYEFARDVPVDCPAKLADEMLSMNPRGVAMGLARDYGAQIFEETVVEKPKPIALPTEGGKG